MTLEWLPRPIRIEAVKVLRRVANGKQAFDRDRLDVAWLIAEGCVDFDAETRLLSLTDKGRGALLHYGTEPSEP